MYVRPEIAGQAARIGGLARQSGRLCCGYPQQIKEHIQKLNIYSRPETPITARWYRSPRHLEKRVLRLLGNLREHG